MPSIASTHSGKAATTTSASRSSTRSSSSGFARCSAGCGHALDDVVDVPPVRIDVRTRVVRVDGSRLQLAQKEYELLLCLAREPDRVFTKAELLQRVWGYRAGARTRTLDSHASRLRRKLREAGSTAGLVENDWGVGYRLLPSLPEE